MSDPTSAPEPTEQPTQQKPDSVVLEEEEVKVKEEESVPLPSHSPTASVAATESNTEVPSSTPSKVRRTEAERRAILQEDPRVQEVEPHKVLCRSCQKWIKLSTNTPYALYNWQIHQQRCAGSVATPGPLRRTPSKPNFSPSSRVATAERKIVLLNDPQVRSCSPRTVHCGNCKSKVVLEGDVDYDLTRWTEHKENCIPMTPAPITPQPSTSRMYPPHSTASTTSQVSARRSVRSPTPVENNSSNNSTEATAVADSPPSASAVKAGVKRVREEEEEEEEEEVVKDVRPTIRPRTEEYKPPEKEAPTRWGWFMQPLKEFSRGFREGLGTRTPPT